MRPTYRLDGVAALDRACRAGRGTRLRYSRSGGGDGDSGGGTGVPALFSSWGWGGDRKDGERGKNSEGGDTGEHHCRTQKKAGSARSNLSGKTAAVPGRCWAGIYTRMKGDDFEGRWYARWTNQGRHWQDKGIPCTVPSRDWSDGCRPGVIPRVVEWLAGGALLVATPLGERQTS